MRTPRVVRTTSTAEQFLLILALAAVLVAGWTGPSYAAQDDLVDIHFDDAPLVQVFQSLARVADLNVLIDPGVTGRGSFTLRDVPATEAIELIARITGYEHTIVGNTLIIGSQTKMREQFQRLDYEMFRLRAADLSRVGNLVSQLYPEVRVIEDHESGILIVRGSESQLAGVREFLSRYDAPAPVDLAEDVTPEREPDPLHFRDDDVESVLWRLADRAGWNMVIQGTVTGRLTAHLEGLDYLDALDLVGEATNVEYRLSNNILYVWQAVPSEDEVAPRSVAIYRLDHTNSEQVAKVLKVLHPDMNIDADEESRTVIIAGTERLLAEVEEFIKDLDVPRRQVIVEARLEEIHVDALKTLGIDWGEGRGAITASGMNPLVLSYDPGTLRGRLEALADQGKSKILASPKLAATDGEEATMLIGDRIPIVLSSLLEDGRVTETIEFVEAGIKLDIIPTISADNSVTLDIHTEVSSITEMMQPQNIPHIRTREMTTYVRVKDGQSLAIGGLIEEEERNSLRGVPFLSEFPIIGQLFSRSVNETVQTEMVIFLIPHVVQDGPIEAVEVDGEGAEDSGRLGPDPKTWEPGTLVSGEEKHETPSEGSSVLWVDVTSGFLGAYDFEFELRHPSRGLVTGVYYSPHGGNTFGVNLGLRGYLGVRSGIAPWGGVGVEYIVRPALDVSELLYSARIGVGINDEGPLRLELFGEYTVNGSGASTPILDIPARWDGLRTGFRLGWQY